METLCAAKKCSNFKISVSVPLIPGIVYSSFVVIRDNVGKLRKLINFMSKAFDNETLKIPKIPEPKFEFLFYIFSPSHALINVVLYVNVKNRIILLYSNVKCRKLEIFPIQLANSNSSKTHKI